LRCAGSGARLSDVEEHNARALGDSGLVNEMARCSPPNTMASCRSSTPRGRARNGGAYREWSASLAPLSLTVREVRLSPRWQLRAAGGTGPSIELGREERSAARAFRRRTGHGGHRARGHAVDRVTCVTATASRRTCRVFASGRRRRRGPYDA
jgi:hypothetical protein